MYEPLGHVQATNSSKRPRNSIIKITFNQRWYKNGKDHMHKLMDIKH